MNKVSWLKTAGFPQYKKIYIASIATALTNDAKYGYLVMKAINKNKNPERHEIIILCTDGNTISLVDRYVKGIDFHGNLGDVAISLTLNETLLFVSATIDDDKETAAMFPVYSWVFDARTRRDIKTYRV